MPTVKEDLSWAEKCKAEEENVGVHHFVMILTNWIRHNFNKISSRADQEFTKQRCTYWLAPGARTVFVGRQYGTDRRGGGAACSARVTLHSVGKHVSLGNRTINRLTLKAEGR